MVDLKENLASALSSSWLALSWLVPWASRLDLGADGVLDDRHVDAAQHLGQGKKREPAEVPCSTFVSTLACRSCPATC